MSSVTSSFDHIYQECDRVSFESKEEWLAWRKTGIGASDAGAIAGESRYGSALSVFREKLSLDQVEREQSEAAAWGLRLEDDIEDAYRERTGETLLGTQIYVRSKARPWQLASLDTATESGKVVDFKATGLWAASTLVEGDIETIPKSWLFQLQHQMSVTGAQKGELAVFSPELRLLLFPVQRNEGLIRSLNEIESVFWDYVTREEEPPALTSDEFVERLKLHGTKNREVVLPPDVQAFVRGYRAADAEIKELIRYKDEARGKILAALQMANTGLLEDGSKVRCSVIDMKERTQTIKAHKQVRITFPKN